MLFSLLLSVVCGVVWMVLCLLLALLCDFACFLGLGFAFAVCFLCLIARCGVIVMLLVSL